MRTSTIEPRLRDADPARAFDAGEASIALCELQDAITGTVSVAADLEVEELATTQFMNRMAEGAGLLPRRRNALVTAAVALVVVGAVVGALTYASGHGSRESPRVATTGSAVAKTLRPSTTISQPTDARPGNVVGIIRIPKIGISQYVIEGTTVDDLRQGPGHYIGTPLPGQIGNAGIAGQRTTYGHPFGDLDQLHTGDEIFVHTRTGTWRYVLSEDPFAVDPGKTDVLFPRTERNLVTGAEEAQTTLTLTTCNPKYSESQRLIVNAHLDDTKPPAPASTEFPTESGATPGRHRGLPAPCTVPSP